MTDEIANTHTAKFDNPLSGLPTAFTLAEDPEYNESHFVFEGLDGMTFYVPKGAIRYRCPRPADCPPQPPVGYLYQFEQLDYWARLGDGLWYQIDPASGDYETVEGTVWEDLWAKHGTPHACALQPVDAINNYQLSISREGPHGDYVIPDMSTGEPRPGLTMSVNNDSGDLTITNSYANQTWVIESEDIVNILMFYFRTSMVKREQMQEEHKGHKHDMRAHLLRHIMTKIANGDIEIVPIELPPNEDNEE